MRNWTLKGICGLLLWLCPLYLVCAGELPILKVSFLLEHEGFLVWYAKEQSWDRELGFELDLKIYNTSGLALLNEKRADPKVWDVTSVGITPFLFGTQGLSLQAVALANDESEATEILVRPQSPILEHRGENDSLPFLYGSTQSVRGQTFMLHSLSSPMHTLISYLQIFGLKLSDIKLKSLSSSELKSAIEAETPSGLVLWSPYTYLAKQSGYITIATAKDLDIYVPMLIVVDRDFAASHAELISKFLALYLRAAREQQENLAALIPAYQRFLQQYIGLPFPELFCQYDLQKHPVLNHQAQLELFSGSPQEDCPLVRQLQDATRDYLHSLSQLKEQQVTIPSFENTVTDMYLKNLPDWQAQISATK